MKENEEDHQEGQYDKVANVQYKKFQYRFSPSWP